MPKFTPLLYKKAKLSAASLEHRRLFVACSQVANECAILVRQMRAAENARLAATDKISAEMATATMLFFVRMAVGRCLELRNVAHTIGKGRATLAKAALALRPDIKPELDAAEQGLKSLEVAWGTKADPGPAALIRDRLSFHLNAGMIDQAVNAMPEDTDMADFLGALRVNTVYSSGEVAQVFALCQIFDDPDPITTLRAVMDLSGQLVGAAGDFANGYAAAFAHVYLGIDVVHRTIETPEPPSLMDPLFFAASEIEAMVTG